jgi:hypothetical protein
MNTNNITTQEHLLIEKIRSLDPERFAEVEDFVDFLRQRNEDRILVRTAAKLSEDTFVSIWNNSEDADYEVL